MALSLIQYFSVNVFMFSLRFLTGIVKHGTKKAFTLIARQSNIFQDEARFSRSQFGCKGNPYWNNNHL